ncbi:hypothetical protein C900_05269 [Fulvivirga imtechensis AK7]|uniref:Fibronectin type-III domain-containing protein n=1 Tax=Fulvivirga imtechensis AK7 TaxID=1237149 RepID=L8JWR8_9BACT|nr:hypothetical protein [Fulvivirga imtechensis]ELR73220.1 hypothetical protein C900_05269 [Fulvivirga imtechensis AK7]
MKRILGLIIWISTIAITQAQQNSEVKVLARAQEDVILLRWAPTDAISWEYGNKYGYTIERYTVIKDSVLLKPAVKILLTPGGIKPEPPEVWEPRIDQNDYAAIAAQAIYGETFELTEDYAKDIVQVINKTKELEQRFSFALFAADQSFKVAEMSGLAFVDKNARENEKYMYKVISNVPDSVQQITPGTFFIGLMDHAPLPQPIDLEATFGDRIVMLKWNREFFERVYNSFVIERSDDGGGTFRQISNQPLINAYTGDTPDARYYYKMDSIPENHIKYVYRVRGISAFGEIGPPSETIEGEGFELVNAQVGITGHDIDGANNVRINWGFRAEKETDIRGFEVQRSGKQSGPFNNINEEEILQPGTRSYIDQRPLSTAYYRIGFVTKYNERRYSHPYLVQLEDSIPPAIPKGISAVIDTSGIISFTWIANQEEDLLGYRVYRSNFKNSEFSQLTSSPIRINSFQDTISLKNLTDKIYYRISAVDSRYNVSEMSDIIEVIKPDLIPPVPPVFEKVEASSEGITIKWTGSSSTDVSKLILYRRQARTDNWAIIADLAATDTFYVDRNLTSGTRYGYLLVAVDEAGNESDPSKPVTLAALDQVQTGRFVKINSRVSREEKLVRVSWQFESVQEPSAYLIYRSAEDEPIALYRRINGSSREFIDRELTNHTQYKYRIKAVFSDGRESGFSEEAMVRY